MIKRIILGLCFLACSFFAIAYSASAPISQEEISEINTFFNSYVDSANNYDENLMKYYMENADIERIVIKKDGTKETINIPIERYKKELKKGKALAKLVNYKNRYQCRKYEKKSGSTYKITALRYPMKDNEGLNAEFIIEKTPFGYKISKEMLETNVQKFLYAE